MKVYFTKVYRLDRPVQYFLTTNSRILNPEDPYSPIMSLFDCSAEVGSDDHDIKGTWAIDNKIVARTFKEWLEKK